MCRVADNRLVHRLPRPRQVVAATTRARTRFAQHATGRGGPRQHHAHGTSDPDCVLHRYADAPCIMADTTTAQITLEDGIVFVRVRDGAHMLPADARENLRVA